MRSTGAVLFGNPDLEQACLNILEWSARDAIFARVLENPDASKRELREVATEAAVILPPRLLDLGPVVLEPPDELGGGPTKMSCTIPITGEAKLMFATPPIWPPARKVRGTVRGGRLVLSAEAWGNEHRWLPAVLASELAEIERILAAQWTVIAYWMKNSPQFVRQLIDKVHPQINPDLLRWLLAQAIDVQTTPLGVLFALNLIVWSRSKLWQEWTRKDDAVQGGPASTTCIPTPLAVTLTT